LYSEGKIKHWAKGKTKYTDERIRKQAEKLIGHSFSNAAIEKMKLAKLKNPVRYWLNKKRDNRTREKIKKFKNTPKEKERARLQRLKQVFPQNDTKIEKMLQNGLKKNDTKFKIHYPVAGQPDIVIFNKGSKIAIFCDGCYWHKCPVCGYGNEQEKDNKINEKLKEQGWIVFRFWEHEINNDLDNCIKQIKSLIK
jgi:DNA mismatch endonuclease (patch repair protein)